MANKLNEVPVWRIERYKYYDADEKSIEIQWSVTDGEYVFNTSDEEETHWLCKRLNDTEDVV